MKGGAQRMKDFKIVKTRTEVTEIFIKAESAESALKQLMERDGCYQQERDPLVQIHHAKAEVDCNEITQDEARGAAARFRQLNSPCERVLQATTSVLSDENIEHGRGS